MPETLKDIRVRMALHSGTAQKRENDYFGSEVNKTARLLSAGWGGQILLSSSALETRDFPGRHRSIRTVFEYSWNILDESDRNAFRDISVFRGGFTKDAAEEVSGISAFGLLSIIDKSLLRKAPDGRFEIHELLREYAGV